MVETFDVGSLPARVEESVLWEGARRAGTILPYVGLGGEALDVFKEQVVGGFIDKLNAGFDIPNYPQYRDMNDMFFDMLTGIEKTESGYLHKGKIKAKPGSSIQEVDLIKGNLSRIRGETGLDKVKVKICVTGPYTLGSFFSVKSPRLYTELGEALSDILERSIFHTRSGETVLLSVDEPVLGFLNDPQLDYGAEGREALRESWDTICRIARLHDMETSMHLHNTSEGLFWDAKYLRILEPHVGDPLYTQDTTKQKLEETDKRLKASIFVTLFDNLIQSRLEAQGKLKNVQEKIGETWNQIRLGKVDPRVFLDEPALIEKRLDDVVSRFGEERVPYTGPECGLGSWPGYELAFECLRRISQVVDKFNSKR